MVCSGFHKRYRSCELGQNDWWGNACVHDEIVRVRMSTSLRQVWMPVQTRRLKDWLKTEITLRWTDDILYSPLPMPIGTNKGSHSSPELGSYNFNWISIVEQYNSRDLTLTASRLGLACVTIQIPTHIELQKLLTPVSLLRSRPCQICQSQPFPYKGADSKLMANPTTGLQQLKMEQHAKLKMCGKIKKHEKHCHAGGASKIK